MRHPTDTKLKQGDQIVYIPTHADDDLSHPDCEFGFIMYTKDDVAACRFWRNPDHITLRTTANSEMCNIVNLELFHSVKQSIVDDTIKWIEEQERVL